MRNLAKVFRIGIFLVRLCWIIYERIGLGRRLRAHVWFSLSAGLKRPGFNSGLYGGFGEVASCPRPRSFFLLFFSLFFSFFLSFYLSGFIFFPLSLSSFVKSNGKTQDCMIMNI